MAMSYEERRREVLQAREMRLQQNSHVLLYYRGLVYFRLYPLWMDYLIHGEAKLLVPCSEYGASGLTLILNIMVLST